MAVTKPSTLTSFTILFLAILQCTSDVVYVDDCASLLESFATSAADFMLCAISNARPIRMCTSCIGAYNSVVEDHMKILEISESDNITCRNRLINLDRLEIIEAGFHYVNALWAKGRCPNCFDEGSQINPSNATVQFQKLYQDTDDCLSKNFNSDNGTYDPDACRNCSLFYTEMNVFYDRLKTRYGDGQLCMDIVDAMNTTQNLWSGVLHCGEESQKIEWELAASCTTILTLPFIFYILAWKLATSTPTPISMQKRLSTRFIERWRSRAGSTISRN